MKILYVSQYFPPEMGAPAARVAELSRHWVKTGHEVTVLTGFPNHPTGIVPPEYRRRLRHGIYRELVDGIHIVRSWLLPLPNAGIRRILNYGSFCFSSAGTGMFLSRPDVVIATSPQLLVGLSGWWLARCKRVPFVLEIRDLWPESLAAVGMGNSDSLLHRSLAALAGFLYSQCDHIAVVSPAFQEHLVTHWKVPPDKISVVANGVETDLFTPLPATDLRRQLGAESKFVVCYIGTMGMAHGLETLIEAATSLQQTAPQVLFILVGEGAEKEHIATLAQSRNLSNLKIIDQQRREKIPGYICASDACLTLLKKTSVFKTVIPTKMLEFMACGRPLILGVDGQAREIMEAAKAGIFIEPENSQDLVGAILKLAENAALRETMGRNGREYILNNLSRRQTAKDYALVLRNVIGPNEVA